MRPFTDPRLNEIEALYRSRHAHFVRVATAIAGDPDAAIDAVQDAFASAVRGRRGFRGEGPLEAWLWRAVVNAARKTRQRRLPDGAAIEERRNGFAPPAAHDLAGAIAALPERQRLALFLRYYADLEYRAIAAALGIEVGTVSATLSAAHAALRRALREVPR